MALRHVARGAGVTTVTILLGLSAAAQGPITQRPYSLQPLPSGRIEVRPFDDTTGAFAGLRRTGLGARVGGTVLTSDGLPAGSVGSVLLRSLVSGRTGDPIPLDPQGQFTLSGVQPGLYVADVVDPGGSLLTSSSAFTVAAGESATIWPVIPARPLSSFAYWTSNSISNALNAAANAGILAGDPPPDATPRQ